MSALKCQLGEVRWDEIQHIELHGITYMGRVAWAGTPWG